MAAQKGTVRALTFSDVPLVKQLVDAGKVFPSAKLDDLLSGYLNDEASRDCWLVMDESYDPAIPGTPVAVAYYAPHKMAEGAWTVLLLAVHPDYQKHGLGKDIMHHIEAELYAKGNRLLMVEVPGTPAFDATHKFCTGLGYTEEARIRDFYKDGEDKVVFWKKIAN